MDMFSSRSATWTGKLLIDKPMHVKELTDVRQVATGQDHLLAVDHKGVVFAMGDDSFGQCG